jgi:hypothetical protein
MELKRHFVCESTACDYCASTIRPGEPAWQESESSIVGCSRACAWRAVALLEAIPRRRLLDRGLVVAGSEGDR